MRMCSKKEEKLKNKDDLKNKANLKEEDNLKIKTTKEDFQKNEGRPHKKLR